MTNRRIQILDAAIGVLGREGVRALTHRAVDASAEVPQGTTSNYFRTREALLDAVVERFAARERAAFDALAERAAPQSPRQLAKVFAAFVCTAVSERRELTLCRFALLVEAAIRPSLREKLGEAGAGVREWATAWLRTAGSADPERDFALLAYHVDGVTLHELANPDPAFDPEPALTVLVDAMVALR